MTKKWTGRGNFRSRFRRVRMSSPRVTDTRLFHSMPVANCFRDSRSAIRFYMIRQMKTLLRSGPDVLHCCQQADEVSPVLSCTRNALSSPTLPNLISLTTPFCSLCSTPFLVLFVFFPKTSIFHQPLHDLYQFLLSFHHLWISCRFTHPSNTQSYFISNFQKSRSLSSARKVKC